VLSYKPTGKRIEVVHDAPQRLQHYRPCWRSKVSMSFYRSCSFTKLRKVQRILHGRRLTN
jgi:hypothetical protein